MESVPAVTNEDEKRQVMLEFSFANPGPLNYVIPRKRNRDSQRHFRERRNRRLKELEERLEIFSKSDNERNAKLIAENNELRRSLSQTKDHILRLRSVFDDLINTMNGETGKPKTKSSSNMLRAHSETSTTNARNWSTSDFQSLEFGPELENSDHTDVDVEDAFLEPKQTDVDVCEWNALEPCETISEAAATLERGNCTAHMGLPFGDVSSISRGRPDNASSLGFEDVAIYRNLPMGFFTSPIEPHFALANGVNGRSDSREAQVFAAPCLHVSFEPQDAQLIRALYLLLTQRFLNAGRSSISAQIDAMMSLMEDYLKLTGGISNANIVNRACLAAMMVFAKNASPFPAVMWFASTCYTLVENVIKWQLKQAFKTFQPLPFNYEPSKLQLSTPHPCVIDWLAFGGLRDRLIEHFNDSAKTDEIFTEIMENSVVEVPDISTILAGVEAGPGFLGIWNIFNAMTGGASNASLQALCTASSLELHDGSLSGLYQMYEVPALDTTRISCHASSGKGFWDPVPLSTLLQSPQLAKQLYHHLELYDSHKCWKYDPGFYARYPMLKWDGYEATLAHGTSYRVSSSWIAHQTQPATPFTSNPPDQSPM